MEIETLDGETLAPFLSRNPVSLVDFFAPWCGPCRAFEPTLRALAEEFLGKVSVAKVDIDGSAELAEAYGIQAVPTILLFRGDQVVGTLPGVRTREDLAKKLRQLIP